VGVSSAGVEKSDLCSGIPIGEILIESGGRGFPMRLAAALLVLIAGLGTSAGAAPAGGEMVSYPSGADTVKGFLALPEGAGRHPAILLVHHWWGLDDFTKDRARHFAAEGYVALAVDLYRGETAGSDAEKAHELSRGLPEDRALQDMEAAFAYLGRRADVDPNRIGAVGWCMGGGYALALAVAEPRLAAEVIYYGRLVTDPAAIAKIHAPLLGNFGALDKGIPPDSVRAFEKAARSAGKEVDFEVFDGVGHAFASSIEPNGNDTPQAREANRRTDEFFAKTLKK
jgi:carboxymethylenebutenolidase